MKYKNKDSKVSIPLIHWSFASTDQNHDPVRGKNISKTSQGSISKIHINRPFHSLSVDHKNKKLEKDVRFGNEINLSHLQKKFSISLADKRHTRVADEPEVVFGADENAELRNSTNEVPANNPIRHFIRELFAPDVSNKLTIKLFGNSKAASDEKRRHEKCGHSFIVHPCSYFRFYWDVFMLLILAANLLVLPVTIAFLDNESSLFWTVFNCASDVLFILDIIVNFRTGIMSNDKTELIILDPKVIARHYMKTWFTLDFISSFPFDYFLLIFSPPRNPDNSHSSSKKFHMIQAGRALRVLRLAKLLSLLRLLRVSRLVRYVSQWEEFLNLATVFIRIFNLVSVMLLVGHWSGCLQFLIPQLQGLPKDCWIVIANLEKSPWFTQYSWSFFKAMSHMLCIGYGRFPPQNVTDMWLTIFSMVSGATCYALFIGHATNLIQSLESANRQYREIMKQVDEYMAFRKLPKQLKIRIQDYFEHKYHGKMFDEDKILNELSDSLRKEVINYNCRDLVASVPFFANADPHFVTSIICLLKYEVFQPLDTIVKEGSVGNKMYFISEGIVDVIADNEIMTSLSEGSYFGEISLMTTDHKRQATIQAATYCHVFSLSRPNFNSILDMYPLMRKAMETIAAERLQKIGRDPTLVGPKEELKDYAESVQEVLYRIESDAAESCGEDDVNHSSPPDLFFPVTNDKSKKKNKGPTALFTSYAPNVSSSSDPKFPSKKHIDPLPQSVPKDILDPTIKSISPTPHTFSYLHPHFRKLRRKKYRRRSSVKS